MSGLLAGVDVGGTTIAVRLATLDLESVGRTVVATVRDQPEQAGRQVVDAIAVACREAGVALDRVAAVGIGVPGQVDEAEGTVRMAVNLGWTAVHLADDVTRILGVPCTLDNDVRAAAEGLRAQRILGDAPDFLYLSVGTGIAAGVVVGDEVLHGAHRFAGEAGHMVVEPGGPVCACGQHGCLESIASGPSIAAYARSLIAVGEASSLAGTGAFTAKEVFAASAAGDPVARTAVDRGAAAMARALHLLGVVIDLPIVAIGGGVTAAGAAFFDPLERALDAVRASSALAATVLPRDLVHPLPAGYEPGTWGAVLLARKGREASASRGGTRKEVGSRTSHP
ncbi:MAG: ROK family protein [Chloroflexota bacterium]